MMLKQRSLTPIFSKVALSTLAFLLILMLISPSAKLTQAQSLYPVNQSASGWELTFSDEFDGAALDRDKWRTDFLNGNNGELQEYVGDDSHNNYLLQNGIFSIVAREESYAGRAYTSGIITTQERFAQKYGYFEIRAKMPVGKGLWPGFWLLPQPTGWPPEIDVVEYLGHEVNTVHMTLHYKNSDGDHDEDGDYYTGPDFSAGWHTFGVEWSPDALVWYVDGTERKRVSDTSIIPNVPMFVLANFAVGGTWPGSPDEWTVFPASYQIDYIRVWKAVDQTAPDPAPSGNILQNASFEETGSSPWYNPWSTRNDLNAAFTQDGTSAVSGAYSFKTTLSAKNTVEPWVVALTQKGMSLTAGQTYTLSIWAKASAPRSIKAVVQEQEAPFTEYFNQTVDLTASWARYVYVFTAPASSSAVMLNLNLAGETGEVWMDEIWTCAGTQDCAPSNAPPKPDPSPTPPAPAPGTNPSPTPTPPAPGTNPSPTLPPPAPGTKPLFPPGIFIPLITGNKP